MEANTISVAYCKHGYLPKHQGELVHISLIPNLGDFFISFTAFGWHINFGHCICTLYQLQRYCYMYINLTCCHGCFCTCFEISRSETSESIFCLLYVKKSVAITGKRGQWIIQISSQFSKMLQTTYMYYGYDSCAFFFEKLKIFKTSRPKIYVQCTMMKQHKLL